MIHSLSKSLDLIPSSMLHTNIFDFFFHTARRTEVNEFANFNANEPQFLILFAIYISAVARHHMPMPLTEYEFHQNWRTKKNKNLIFTSSQFDYSHCHFMRPKLDYYVRTRALELSSSLQCDKYMLLLPT